MVNVILSGKNAQRVKVTILYEVTWAASEDVLR